MQIEVFRHKFEISDNNLKVIIFSAIHFLLSIINDIFTFGVQSNYFIIKILFFVVLLIFWKKALIFLKAICSKDQKALKFVYNLIPILSFNLLVLIFTWPGNWIWDDISVYNFSLSLDINYWQHFFTSLFYFFSIMIIPVPIGAASIILVQLIIISIISAYVLTIVQENFNTKYLQYILYIPFVLPATIYLNTHPLRLTLYGYLDLLFIVMLIDSYRNMKITKERLAILSFAAIILSVWRTEGIYYAILSPLLFIVLFNKTASSKYKKIFSATVISVTCICNIVQNAHLQSDYSVTAFLYPIVPLTERAYSENNMEFLDKVDKIYNVEILLEGAENGLNGEYLYWNEPLVREFEQEDYSEFKMAYIKTCIKYFDTFIIERTKTFLSSNSSRIGFCVEEEKAVEFFKNNKPLFTDLRTELLFGLSEKNKAIEIFWQPWVPILLMFIIAVSLLFIKKFAYSSILFLSGIKVLLVFITAPGVYFMYYFPTYLCGYFCVAFVLFYLILKIKSKF